MKTLIYSVSICAFILYGCESEPTLAEEVHSISIYAESIVGKWRLGETLEVREFTEEGLAFAYNIEEGRGELFQYFDADESHLQFYKEKYLSGESHTFPYSIDSDSTGGEHLIITVIHPEGQGFIDADYTRIE